MQLKVALATGTTLTFALPDEIGAWQAKQADPAFQRSIRSLGLLHCGHSHALPAPVSFGRVTYMAEVLANGNGKPASSRIGYVADDVMAWLTVYFKGSPPLARYDLRKTGKLRWSPGSSPTSNKEG